MTKAVFLRFLRGAVAGGVANLAAIFVSSKFEVASLTDLQNLGYSLGIAFIGGAILAIDKMLRYEDLSSETSNS